MPIAPTYPGVYVEEIPTGVRAIAGVATSITAFVGFARRGPVDEPTCVRSFAEFARNFGGHWEHSTMSHAVQHYFLNGGQEAIIVRAARLTGPVANRATKSTLTLGAGASELKLEAVNAGTWGNKLLVRVDHETGSSADTTLYNLSVKDTDTGEVEHFGHLSAAPADPRFVTRVLEQTSKLIRVPSSGTTGNTRPPAHAAMSAGGDPLADTSAAPFSANGADGDRAVTELVPTSRNATGIYALDKADLFNLLCIPPITRGGDLTTTALSAASAYCAERRALLIVDPHSSWDEPSDIISGANALSSYSRLKRQNSAIYFPRITIAEPLLEGALESFPPCGAVAGIIARTDAKRGVWKAPAGEEAALTGVQGLSVNLTGSENDQLNALGVNCLRTFPVIGNVVWGARTMEGADALASEWKYIPVRRLALFLEESLSRGTRWVVFEPNDEPLWAQIRLNVGAFLHNLFRQGAFQGTTPSKAYFVKCDKETTTQNDINLGIVNILVGFAPLKPAEFVIIRIQQLAASSGREHEAAAQVSDNAQRFDPYRNFKFRVKWEGRYVAGVSKVSSLKRTTEVVRHREGGDPSSSRESPARSEYEAITLEWGVTHDTEFEKWASKVCNGESATGTETSLADCRKDIIIEEYGEAEQLVLAYTIYRCWVSEYQAVPDLDAKANAVAIQTLKLENEGWERDHHVPEPSNPTYTEPAG